MGTAVSDRQAEREPYVQVVDGDLLILPTADSNASAALKARIKSGAFIAFVSGLADDVRQIGAVLIKDVMLVS